MLSIYTKEVAKKLIPIALYIEAVREFRNCIQVTYRANGGRCSTFLSKKLFLDIKLSIGYKTIDEIEVVKTRTDTWSVLVNNQPVGSYHYDDWAIGNEWLVMIDGQEFGWFATSARAEQALINRGRKGVAAVA